MKARAGTPCPRGDRKPGASKPRFWPAPSSVATPSTRKISAASPCTSFSGTRPAMRSPKYTAGTFASIMPSVVPATTATALV